MTYRFRRATAADRRISSQIEEGHIGIVSDEAEGVFGSPDTPIGRFFVAPQMPRDGVDVRRMWVASNQGQSDTWTDVDGVAQDSSGIFISPKPHASPGTDIVATGVVLANELADGGSFVIEATGTYKCGSILPRILAKLKIGANYVAPQYETAMNLAGSASTPTDVSFVTANAFEWSSITLGLNALGGYDSLNAGAANLESGLFQWRLTMRVTSMGRYAKWENNDDDVTDWLTATGYTASTSRVRSNAAAGRVFVCSANHTSGGTTEPGVGASWETVWTEITGKAFVEATLEWGALQYNAGGRCGEPFGYYNPAAVRNAQYHAHMPSGTIRGSVYSFLGQQWLCHAASATTALDTAADPDALVLDTWTEMLSEEAPGIGTHWKEFFVPIVSRATFTAAPYVDWTVDNQVQLELGGPQQVDLGTSFAAYGATTAYTAELSAITPAVPDGTVWVAKTFAYTSLFPRFAGGLSDVTGGTASLTEAPDAATALKHRIWRQLPATMRDTMRMQTTQAYLFGGRKGTAQKRLR